MNALADGEWHRLHPATPLLRGGIALVAIIGVILANLRERLVELLIGFGEGGDPWGELAERGLLGVLAAAVAGGLLLGIGAFYLSWRMNTFRVTDEAVETRSGILFRTHRNARLDRIQGINIVRPLFARLFGAARLEVNVAGQDANVKLSYLASGAADSLRKDILALASGMRRAEAVSQEPSGLPGALPVRDSAISQRIGEFLAPELDPDAGPPESIVRISVGRLIASTVLSGFTIILLVVVFVAIPWSIINANFYWIFVAGPALLGMAGIYVNRITKSLRYSISSSPDGIRVGFGLLSLTNETLPPGRIHAIRVSQPLLWRPFGWWQIQINRASSSSTNGAAGQANTTILPVGDSDDVLRVISLILPGIAETGGAEQVKAGMFGTGNDDDDYRNAPARAVWLRPFSWRRTGFALTGAELLFRSGAIWRSLVLVPQARLQSVSVSQGPLSRALALAELHVQTVAGPVSARMEIMDAQLAVVLFGEVRRAAVASGAIDRSEQWRRIESAEAPDAAGDAIIPVPVISDVSDAAVHGVGDGRSE